MRGKKFHSLFFIYLCILVHHISLILIFNVSIVVMRLSFSSFIFIQAQQFSIGLRSGEFPGHSRMVKPSYRISSFTGLALWQWVLSCWNIVQLCAIKVFFKNISLFANMIYDIVIVNVHMCAHSAIQYKILKGHILYITCQGNFYNSVISMGCPCACLLTTLAINIYGP